MDRNAWRKACGVTARVMSDRSRVCLHTRSNEPAMLRSR
jgi:hypothetical protein